jgi:GH18 family chitinase
MFFFLLPKSFYFRVMDWFNLMTYDFHGSWDQNRAHHSSLNSKDDEKDDTMYIVCYLLI